MVKNYTSIEQSKKLAKILPIESADMWYSYYGNPKYNPTIAYEGEQWFLCQIRNSSHDIPCWSLPALLELIPPYLGEFNEGIDFGFGKAMNGKWYSAHYLQSVNEYIKPVKTTTGDTAVDAAFEMVVWLKENKKI